MNQTSCVAMYNHVQLLVIHANQRFAKHHIVGEGQIMTPEGGGRERGVTQLMRSICARG